MRNEECENCQFSCCKDSTAPNVTVGIGIAIGVIVGLAAVVVGMRLGLQMY